MRWPWESQNEKVAGNPPATFTQSSSLSEGAQLRLLSRGGFNPFDLAIC